MLVGLTAMLAQWTEIEECAVSEDEVKGWTKSAQNVMRHYSVDTTQKTLDWVALMGASLAIVGPRVASRKFRKYAAQQQQSQPSNVVRMNGIDAATMSHIQPDMMS